MGKYSIGIDFGTLSGRGVLLDLETGEEKKAVTKEYSHGVMGVSLPCGKKLGADWALQDAADYLGVLFFITKELAAAVDSADIAGMGIDFTSCTVLPITKDGAPLSCLPEFADEPHAYVKLWKHHAAQPYADRLNEIALGRNEKWLARYGGKISSEWLFPKIWQVLDEAPRVYEAMDRFIEAGDWIVLRLTGEERRNACCAGYKAMWHKQDGYPEPAFFKALDPRLEHVVKEKLCEKAYPMGSLAGGVTAEMARETGLKAGTPVAVSSTDAHICLPAVQVTKPSQLFAVMGTSSCYMLLGERELEIPGICGCVEDGMLAGFFGYEAGQSCVGDGLAWFVENAVSASCYEAARQKGVGIHQHLQELGSGYAAGQSGLLALDWLNGNRSILVDGGLSGMVLGLSLQTKPEEIYRALVEATAFGMRLIIENFEAYGIAVDEIVAAGGIAEKSPLIMQIYADILRKEIRVSGNPNAPARAAAMYGAVAGGAAGSIEEAAERWGRRGETRYTANESESAVYDKLYAEYKTLHDYFGTRENPVMKTLKALAKQKGNV